MPLVGSAYSARPTPRDPEHLCNSFGVELRSERRVAVGTGNVWEIRIGGRTKDELLAELSQRGVMLNDYARALFADPEFTTANEERTVRVEQISLFEIGLPEGGTFDAIVARAARSNLRLCPLEVGPCLRLAYLDQPPGPYLTVASPEPGPGTGSPNGFYLRHLDDGLWLRGFEAGPENIYPPDFSDFVFEVANE